MFIVNGTADEVLTDLLCNITNKNLSYNSIY